MIRSCVINMDDIFVYYKCVDGHCPLVVEEELYGCRTSTCQDYCGGGFCGCNNCWFDGSPYCKDCVHNEKKVRASEQNFLVKEIVSRLA